MFVKWSFSRRLGGDVSHTAAGGYSRHKSGKSNPMQISILWVAAAIIPIIMVLGAALGAGAMLAIFAEAVRRPRDKP